MKRDGVCVCARGVCRRRADRVRTSAGGCCDAGEERAAQSWSSEKRDRASSLVRLCAAAHSPIARPAAPPLHLVALLSQTLPGSGPPAPPSRLSTPI